MGWSSPTIGPVRPRSAQSGVDGFSRGVKQSEYGDRGASDPVVSVGRGQRRVELTTPLPPVPAVTVAPQGFLVSCSDPRAERSAAPGFSGGAGC